MSVAATLIRDRRLRVTNPALAGLREEAWLMLLDLYMTGRPTCVSSLCKASHAPDTTALRHIGILTDAGLAKHARDPKDRRRRWLVMTRRGRAAVDAHLVKIGGANVVRVTNGPVSVREAWQIVGARLGVMDQPRRPTNRDEDNS